MSEKSLLGQWRQIQSERDAARRIVDDVAANEAVRVADLRMINWQNEYAAAPRSITTPDVLGGYIVDWIAISRARTITIQDEGPSPHHKELAEIARVAAALGIERPALPDSGKMTNGDCRRWLDELLDIIGPWKPVAAKHSRTEIAGELSGFANLLARWVDVTPIGARTRQRASELHVMMHAAITEEMEVRDTAEGKRYRKRGSISELEERYQQNIQAVLATLKAIVDGKVIASEAARALLEAGEGIEGLGGKVPPAGGAGSESAVEAVIPRKVETVKDGPDIANGVVRHGDRTAKVEPQSMKLLVALWPDKVLTVGSAEESAWGAGEGDENKVRSAISDINKALRTIGIQKEIVRRRNTGQIGLYEQLQKNP